MRFRPRDVGFFLLAALSIVPLWVVQRVPSQDWPQHVAAVRVLIDHAEPALRLGDAVQIDLGRTQYVGFYLLAALLAKLVGAPLAVKLLMSCTLFAIPYALRALLRESGGDERYAPFAVALTYTTHVLLGFLTFLAAVPLSLFALLAAIRYRTRPSVPRALWLSLLLVALFFMHVMPFGFALCGTVLILSGCSWRALAGGMLAVVPSIALTFQWQRDSEAGSSTATMLHDALTHTSSSKTKFESLSTIVSTMPEWLTDILPGDADLALLASTCAVLLVFGIALRERGSLWHGTAPRSVRLVMVMPLFALGCAFVLPVSHDWIWPISSRFPYLFLLLLPLLLPRMQKKAGDVCTLVLGLLALLHVGLIGLTYRKIERNEARGFDGALAALPVGASVFGLMFGAASQYTRRHVFMHYHAHVQAEHGGVLMFSFAMLPQSPFTYAPPPAGPPYLETGGGWAAQNADLRVASSYYEYCLVHGFHPALHNVQLFYESIYSANDWTVYRRR